jgi:hypothetical protein
MKIKLLAFLFLLLSIVTIPALSAWNDLPTDKVFAPTSFWYTRIPADAPLHINNANYVAEFLRQKTKYYGNVNLNTTQFTSPVYLSKPTDPIVPVTIWKCQTGTYLDPVLLTAWEAVPMPSFAAPSAGSDAEMTIYDKTTDSLYEFWKLRKNATTGAMEACWGGGFKNVSTSSGIFGKYGTTATGLPFIGGQITPEELIRGEIRHVIGISLVDVEHYSIRSWPALRSDGWNPNAIPNRIPEGLRFRLDPAFNVGESNLSPVAKIIAKAAQEYGFVVWDKAGAISLRMQNARTQTQLGMVDLYPLLFKGAPNYAVLNGFPWDKLQFLPMDYGKP